MGGALIRVTPISKALVSRAQAGDLDAQGELWRQIRPRLRHFLGTKISDPELHREVEQQTALRYVLKLHQFKNEAPFHNWLFTVAIREWLQILRLKKECPELVYSGLPPENDDEIDLLYRAAANLPDPDLRIDAKKRLAFINEKYRRLYRRKPLQAQAWFMHRIRGVEASEIGRRTGVKTATAKSRLFKGAQVLDRWIVNG